MCYFITVGIPNTKSEAVRGEVPRGFGLEPVENKSVLAALPLGYQTFLLVSGGCSCNLYQRAATPALLSHNPDRLRRKYEKKGWSTAKIDRAIKQSLPAQAKPSDFIGFRSDVTDILRSVSRNAGDFAILIHWYNGNIDDELISMDTPQRINPNQLGDVVPEEDRLLWVAGE